VIRDTDDTTVHRGTKFSRYWYRWRHNTTGYFVVPRFLKYSGIFTVLSSKCFDKKVLMFFFLFPF